MFSIIRTEHIIMKIYHLATQNVDLPTIKSLMWRKVSEDGGI